MRILEQPTCRTSPREDGARPTLYKGYVIEQVTGTTSFAIYSGHQRRFERGGFASTVEAQATIDQWLRNFGVSVAPVESLKRGEYVKREPTATKVYTRGAYNRLRHVYELIDCEDMNRIVRVRKGTELFIGFTY